jgi:hypothetical protein
MKKTFWIFLLFAFSCKGNIVYKTCVDTASVALTNEIISTDISAIESFDNTIDTTEFIAYWQQFRDAVLKHDTLALLPMINDTFLWISSIK